MWVGFWARFWAGFGAVAEWCILLYCFTTKSRYRYSCLPQRISLSFFDFGLKTPTKDRPFPTPSFAFLTMSAHADRQISQMCKFILQEANEKATEIRVKTEVSAACAPPAPPPSPRVLLLLGLEWLFCGRWPQRSFHHACADTSPTHTVSLSLLFLTSLLNYLRRGMNNARAA